MDITKILSGIRIFQDSAPLYLQIANSLATKILDYSLPAGTKLPPERELARLLEVSRTTAINAYRLLEERGLVKTKVGSGTYVCELASASDHTAAMPWNQLFTPQYKSPLSSMIRTLIAEPTADNIISLAAGLPDPAFYPLDLVENILVSCRQMTDNADFGHIATEGYMPLRHSLANWQHSRGIQTFADNILVVSGSQQGLYLTVKAFIEPRDYVIVESPTYLGAIQVLESAGARILSLPNSSTLDFNLLEDYLIRYRPKMLYTIPTFQNPSGRVMPLQERQELIRLAARYRLPIVEDDPYSLLHYEQQPPPPLKALDTYGGVIYLSTFSKILMPGLRTGWVTAAPQVINRLAQEKQYIDLHTNNLAQKILHAILEENYLTEHLKMVRSEYKKRRDAMANAIRRYSNGQINFSLPGGGFYLWCQIAPPSSASELLRRAAAAGVSFVPGEAFYTGGANSNEIRLCFATHREERLTEGIRTLAKILTSGKADVASPAASTGRPLI